jgi:hypothetical protein
MPMMTQDARMRAPGEQPSDDRHATQERRNVAVSAPCRLLDHAAFGPNCPNAENVIDSQGLERALREKPAPTFSQRALALAVALLCVAGTARAQSLGGAIGEAAETFQFRRAPPPAAEFVESARPDELGFRQLAPTDRANHRKSAAELDALASSLENAKATNRRAAQRVRAPDGPAGTKTAKAKLDPQDR